MDAVYDFLRSASGFALIVAGISLMLQPGRPQVFHYFGRMFLCIGCLFTLSALDSRLHLPEEAGDFLVILLIYFLSQSLFNISLSVFGGERRPGLSKSVWLIGAFWSLFLWLLPFLDYALVVGSPRASLEDGQVLGFFHHLTDGAVYLWPIGILVASLTMTRLSLRDVPRKLETLRPLVVGLAVILFVLGTIVGALALNSVSLYRFAHTSLEAAVLVWYFFVAARPDAFEKFRDDLQLQFLKRTSLPESESKIIEERLNRLVSVDQIYRNSRMSLDFLAKRIQVPAYRLSGYLNQHQNSSFPEWLNGLRIRYVSQELLKRPEVRILDLAQEAGYSTKGIFNTQFKRLLGVSPREFRKNASTSLPLSIQNLQT